MIAKGFLNGLWRSPTVSPADIVSNVSGRQGRVPSQFDATDTSILRELEALRAGQSYDQVGVPLRRLSFEERLDQYRKQSQTLPHGYQLGEAHIDPVLTGAQSWHHLQSLIPDTVFIDHDLPIGVLTTVDRHGRFRALARIIQFGNHTGYLSQISVIRLVQETSLITLKVSLKDSTSMKNIWRIQNYIGARTAKIGFENFFPNAMDCLQETRTALTTWQVGFGEDLSFVLMPVQDYVYLLDFERALAEGHMVLSCQSAPSFKE